MSSRGRDTRSTTELYDEPACLHARDEQRRDARGSDRSSRETGAALGPAVLDHGTAAARAHTGTEPVLLGTSVGIGLKCTLHVVLLENPAGCSAGLTRSDASCNLDGRFIAHLDLTRLRVSGLSRQPHMSTCAATPDEHVVRVRSNHPADTRRDHSNHHNGPAHVAYVWFDSNHIAPTTSHRRGKRHGAARRPGWTASTAAGRRCSRRRTKKR